MLPRRKLILLVSYDIVRYGILRLYQTISSRPSSRQSRLQSQHSPEEWPWARAWIHRGPWWGGGGGGSVLGLGHFLPGYNLVRYISSRVCQIINLTSFTEAAVGLSTIASASSAEATALCFVKRGRITGAVAEVSRNVGMEQWAARASALALVLALADLAAAFDSSSDSTASFLRRASVNLGLL